MRFLKRTLVIIFPIVFALSLAFLFIPKAQAQSASIYFSPSSSQQIAGNNFSIAVRVNTGGVAINATEGSIVFDPAKITVISISKSGSIFSLWTTEPMFSNSDGTINFGGGIPNPGYSGSNGLIITVNFKAKTATTVRGYSEIVLVSGAVLANDGEGTNILSSLGKHTLYIGASAIPATTPSATAAPSATAGNIPAPQIKSSTHPDSDKWYNLKDAEFSWDVPTGVLETRLALTRDSLEAPHVRYSPPISEKSLPDLEDGIWYLNAQFRTASGLGPTESFKFQIDTVPPKNLTVETGYVDNDNSKPEIILGAEDDLSGIDHYELSIASSSGKKQVINIDKQYTGKPYQLSSLAAGVHNVYIKAIDAAGNFAEASTEISVVQPENKWLKLTFEELGRLFDYIINFLSDNILLIAFILALIGLLISLVKLMGRNIRSWWAERNKRKFIKKTEKKSSKVLSHLIKDIEEELDFLKSIGRRRKLSLEDKYLQSKLAQYLKTLKTYNKNKW